MRRETDLYEPVKAFLEAQGFAVKAEVNQCDVVAVRGENVVVVELKASFNLALVLQAIDRQKIADAVYVAVEAPRSARGRWKELLYLCRRLGLGMLTVSFMRKVPGVEVVCDPEPLVPRRNVKRQGLLLKEFRARTTDVNLGGSTKRPLVTSYREEALKVAAYLHEQGPSTPKMVKAGTGITRAAAICQGNVYGWFERVSKGIYSVTPKGAEALTIYADVVAQL